MSTHQTPTLRTRLRAIAHTLRVARSPARTFVALVLARTGASSVLSIPQDGFRLRFYPSSISAALWADPRARSEDVAFIRTHLRASGTYVDVGANIGQLAIAAAMTSGVDGRVVAIEANPRVFRYLQGNVALNHLGPPAVRLVNVAVGERDGTVVFTDVRADDVNRVVMHGTGLEVPMKRLDDLLKDIPRIDLLKIDVEGFEKSVLLGATEVLKRTDKIYLEYSDANCTQFGYRAIELVDLLERSGFGVFAVDRDARPVPLDRRSLPATTVNLVAISRDRGRPTTPRRSSTSLAL